MELNSKIVVYERVKGLFTMINIELLLIPESSAVDRKFQTSTILINKFVAYVYLSLKSASMVKQFVSILLSVQVVFENTKQTNHSLRYIRRNIGKTADLRTAKCFFKMLEILP